MGYLEILDTYHDEMLKELGESVSKPSVLSAAVKTADGEVLPFGRGVHDAFMHMLGLGKKLGFGTVNSDNYGGHIEFPAADETVIDEDGNVKKADTFGIVAHLDVVPEGTGWTGEPFVMSEKEGFVYGRGVSDDKGPAIACLYAMKALKESGFEPEKNIRLILGLDEETEKIGMTHYLEKVGGPDMGFTPDADFPLVNGEMGILIFDIAQKLTRQPAGDGLRLTKMEAGTAPNAVPRTAKVVITADAALYDVVKDRIAQYTLETGYDVRGKKQGPSMVIEAYGVAAHGAHPELGLNAISILMDFLGRLQFNNEEINDFVEFYNNCIGFDLHGERMGCEMSDEPSGPLVFNVGMAMINEDIAQVTINIRYPVSSTDVEVYAGIEEILKDSKLGIVKNYHEGPIYMDMSNPMVAGLLGAYREETGDNEAMPFVIGGGTYAKMVKNTLAFGAQFPGEENTMHQADEKLAVDSLFSMARIYARALHSLCGKNAE